MRFFYERELSGGYYITMTPGVRLREEDLARMEQRATYRAIAVDRVMTQPGLRLRFGSQVRQKVTLELPGGEEERKMLQEDWHEKNKLLLLEQPLLTLGGYLMGWKIIRLDILKDGGVSVTFCDVWNWRLIELFVTDKETGKAPEFSVNAMGENGVTQYVYMGMVDGILQVWEKSELHERTVKIGPSGRCEIEEIIKEQYL